MQQLYLANSRLSSSPRVLPLAHQSAACTSLRCLPLAACHSPGLRSSASHVHAAAASASALASSTGSASTVVRRSSKLLGARARPGSVPTSRAGLLVRVSVLERQDASSSKSSSTYGNATAWSAQQQGAPDERHSGWLPPTSDSESRIREEEADHSGNQITLFLSLSVTLITLPWMYRHPETLLVPAALLALPMPGAALRPAIREGFSLVLSAARWMAEAHHSQNHGSSCSNNSSNSNSGTSSQATPSSPGERCHQHASTWHAASGAPQHAHSYPYGSHPSSPYHPPSHPSAHSHAAGAGPSDKQQQYHSQPQPAKHGPSAWSPARHDSSSYQPGPAPHTSSHTSSTPHDEYGSTSAHHFAGAADSLPHAPSHHHWSPAAVDSHHVHTPSHTSVHTSEAVLDADWPASSSSSSSHHAPSMQGGDHAHLTWQQRHPHVYQNLDGASPEGPAGFARGTGTAYAPSFDPATSSGAAGPCSTWPRPRQAAGHAAPHPAHMPHAPATSSSAATMAAASTQPHPHAPAPAGHAQHRPASPGGGSAEGSPLAAPRPHGAPPRDMLDPSGAGEAGEAEPSWATPLFSIAPWMRSWGGFL